MRLPEFLTQISPISETLDAIQVAEAVLQDEVNHKNQQLSVSTADDALSLWEADFSLPDASGSDIPSRRAQVRAAFSAGRTLTPTAFSELAVALADADHGIVFEDFQNWQVHLCAVSNGRTPPDISVLEKAIHRLKPAHLQVSLSSEAHFHGAPFRQSTHHARTLLQNFGHDVLHSQLPAASALYATALTEFSGSDLQHATARPQHLLRARMMLELSGS